MPTTEWSSGKELIGHIKKDDPLCLHFHAFDSSDAVWIFFKNMFYIDLIVNIGTNDKQKKITQTQNGHFNIFNEAKYKCRENAAL